MVGSKNALGQIAYTGPKIVIGLRPKYKFRKTVPHRYAVESNSRVNAEHITVEGSHVVTRALRPINAGSRMKETAHEGGHSEEPPVLFARSGVGDHGQGRQSG